MGKVMVPGFRGNCCSRVFKTLKTYNQHPCLVKSPHPRTVLAQRASTHALYKDAFEVLPPAPNNDADSEAVIGLDDLAKEISDQFKEPVDDHGTVAANPLARTFTGVSPERRQLISSLCIVNGETKKNVRMACLEMANQVAKTLPLLDKQLKRALNESFGKTFTMVQKRQTFEKYVDVLAELYLFARLHSDKEEAPIDENPLRGKDVGDTLAAFFLTEAPYASNTHETLLRKLCLDVNGGIRHVGSVSSKLAATKFCVRAVCVYAIEEGDFLKKTCLEDVEPLRMLDGGVANRFYGALKAFQSEVKRFIENQSPVPKVWNIKLTSVAANPSR